MRYAIRSDELMATIDSNGAALLSLKDRAKREYIWQRDPAYWELSDINIFPYVARLTNETFSFADRRYLMGIHGFLWTSELAVIEETPSSLTFELRSSPATREHYPFEFIVHLKRALFDQRLETSWTVTNTGADTMFFGLGGHPAFRVPIDETGHFSDYSIRFDADAMPKRVEMSEDCFVLDGRSIYPLTYGEIPLEHELFDHDAIILTDMGSHVMLHSPAAPQTVELSFPDMRYLGIWHMPRTDAHYVCIEPWSSLPARKGVVEDLATQPDLISLDAGERYRNVWTVTINS